VSPGWPPDSYANGIVTYIGNARQGLARAGVESYVFTGNVESDGPDVVSLKPYAPPRPLLAASKVYERLTGMTTSAWNIGYAVAGALRATHQKTPLDLFEMEESFGSAWYAQGAIPNPMVVRLHGPWCLVSPALGLPDDAKFRRRVALEGCAIRDADCVSSPSRGALDEVRRYYGIELAEAEVVPNPVNLEPPEQRWSYEASDKKTVLFVGRFDRLKGADLVLAAFCKLAREIPRAELLLVGPEPGLLVGGRRFTFDEYARAELPSELLPRIRRLGQVALPRIAELRRSSFVTVVASRYETFSMTTVEALAFGSPLVGPDAGGVAEIIEHEKNGLAFRHDNADDLASKLVSLFRHPDFASRLGAAGAEDVAKRFTPDAIAPEMAAFYQRVRKRVRNGALRRPRAKSPLSALFPR
jgi:glycosyltransferase involved in cell wall biosynthesis